MISSRPLFCFSGKKNFFFQSSDAAYARRWLPFCSAECPTSVHVNRFLDGIPGTQVPPHSRHLRPKIEPWLVIAIISRFPRHLVSRQRVDRRLLRSVRHDRQILVRRHCRDCAAMNSRRNRLFVSSPRSFVSSPAESFSDQENDTAACDHSGNRNHPERPDDLRLFLPATLKATIS